MTATATQQKCMSPRLPNSSYLYKALFIGWVPAVEPHNEYQHCAGDNSKLKYTVDALVCLQEMDKGRVVQVPMHNIQLVDDWPEKEE